MCYKNISIWDQISYSKLLNSSILIVFCLAICFKTSNAYSQNNANDDYLNATESAKKGDFVSALTSISEAVKQAPQNHEYLAYKGYVLRNNKNFTEALNCIEKAIQLNSEVAWYYVEAVACAYELKNLVLVKKYSEKALTFGEISMGKDNFNYIKNTLDNLKQDEYILNFNFNPENKNLVYENDGSLCLPVPSTDLPYQKSSYKIIGATLNKSVKENDFELIYIKPNKNEVSIVCTIIKIPYSYINELKKANTDEAIPDDIQKYLESSNRVNLKSEVILNIAKQLKGKNESETIDNILKWINETKIKGKAPIWKTVDDIIKSQDIECATGSLTVVALLRANGIPARQVWGPIDAGRNYSPENYLKGHVWFEFYLKGAGWIPVEQFDRSSVGMLPISYIRIITNPEHLFDNIPLGNIMTIMHNDKYGDIIEYKRAEIAQ
jgi:tetratricopeptide (TPR) repeat protein